MNSNGDKDSHLRGTGGTFRSLLVWSLILLICWSQVAVVVAEDFKIERKKYIHQPDPSSITRARRVNPVTRPQVRSQVKPQPTETTPSEEVEVRPNGPRIQLPDRNQIDNKGPEIRIALATDVANASITSNQSIVYLNAEDQELVELATKQVKVQLGNISSSRERPGRVYRVQVANLRSSREADTVARNLQKKFGEPAEVKFDENLEQYNVALGEFSSQQAAQAFMVQVMNAGYKKTWVAKYDSSRIDSGKERLIKAITSDGESLAAVRDRLVLVSQDDDSAPLKFNGNPYRGKLEVFVNKRGRLSVINRLSMEDYVRGVVPNELSPSGFPMIEALKAQAVAARTYAMRNMGQFDAEGYDLLPTTLSQVYGGKGTEHPLTDRAVQETWGMVATYDGKPINALYTSTCGGRTESSEYVFTEAVPYLVSVACEPQNRSRRAQDDNDRQDDDRDNYRQDDQRNNDQRNNQRNDNRRGDDRNSKDKRDRNDDRKSKSNNDDRRTNNDNRNNIDNRLLRTARRAEPIVLENGRAITKEVATLSILGFPFAESQSSSYFQAAISEKDVYRWVARASQLVGRAEPANGGRDVANVAGFATLLATALYGEDRSSVLLMPADADYILGADAEDIPARNRPEVAALLQDGILLPAADGSLHARTPMTRGSVLMALSRVLAKFGKPALENGTARSVDNRRIRIRTSKSKDGVEFDLVNDLYLFRVFNNEAFPSASLKIVGGEKVNYHLDERGRIDYLEVVPNTNGAASDHYSVYSRWQTQFTPGELKARLADARVNVGDILDLKGTKFGLSHRVSEMKIIGRDGEKLMTGLRVRSALGLRETLFVVQREYDTNGEVSLFKFVGRGWGHGVGMCQVGAYGLALEGLDYQAILKTYYSGIELTKLY